MLDIHAGTHLRFCDRLSRRRALQVGALGTLGIGLPHLLSSQAQARTAISGGGSSSTFGRAKRVILLYMWGGPAHQDTWDLKPEGPVETRGEFRPIETNVPGILISEHFPLIAQQADKLAIIRSVAQEDNNHSTGAHAGLTGRRHELKAENFGARQSDFPHYGSVLSKLSPSGRGLPSFVALPEVIATTAGKITPGQGAGFLGRKYDPFQIVDHPDEPDFSIEALRLPGSLSVSRMSDRRQLLQQIDQVARLSDRSRSVYAMDQFYRQALEMVLSPQARRAFDIAAVADRERWRYGWHTFGQSVLMARRLIEAGVKLVTVYWHREDKRIDTTWDTHSLNFQELKNRLMPSVDRPIAALLEDLQASGLLDETLVIWNSEFGRTPRINKNAGRDHWGACNTVVMAGGGMPGGQVFGETDRQAAHPVSDKVTQDDIAATIYHLLGFDPHRTLIHDRTGRPYPVALGQPIDKLLGNESRPTGPLAAPALRLDRRPSVRGRIGPFHRMLKERGRRYLVCEFGYPESENQWELTGWTEIRTGAPSPTGQASVHGDGSAGVYYRAPAGESAAVKYLGHFYPHFDYGYAVFRLAEARPIADVALSVGGRPVPVPQELIEQGAQRIWQVPFPRGLIAATKTFTLTVEADDWPLSAFALVGDRIRELHLSRL